MLITENPVFVYLSGDKYLSPRMSQKCCVSELWQLNGCGKLWACKVSADKHFGLTKQIDCVWHPHKYFLSQGNKIRPKTLLVGLYFIRKF